MYLTVPIQHTPQKLPVGLAWIVSAAQHMRLAILTDAGGYILPARLPEKPEGIRWRLDDMYLEVNYPEARMQI